MVAPKHYTIRANWRRPSNEHLKSWLVEMSADAKGWREIPHEEDNKRLNGNGFPAHL
jgi:hypothetical protein